MIAIDQAMHYRESDAMREAGEKADEIVRNMNREFVK